MTSSIFKPGDIVFLRSGGPDMTVLTTSATGNRVEVGWFAISDAKGEALRREWLDASCIEIATDDDGEGGDGERTAQVVDIGIPANSDASPVLQATEIFAA